MNIISLKYHSYSFFLIFWTKGANIYKVDPQIAMVHIDIVDGFLIIHRLNH